MKNAEQQNEFKVEADYSYTMETFSGDGYVLIGDAARFVDPIFSSGVSVAVFSAKFAAESIISAWESQHFTTQAFSGYEKTLRSGTSIWYEFIRLFYRLQITLPHFLADKTWRSEIIPLLQGDVYDREKAPVLAEMRKLIEQVESDPEHPYRMALDVSIDV